MENHGKESGQPMHIYKEGTPFRDVYFRLSIIPGHCLRGYLQLLSWYLLCFAPILNQYKVNTKSI